MDHGSVSLTFLASSCILHAIWNHIQPKMSMLFCFLALELGHQNGYHMLHHEFRSSPSLFPRRGDNISVFLTRSIGKDWRKKRCNVCCVLLVIELPIFQAVHPNLWCKVVFLPSNLSDPCICPLDHLMHLFYLGRDRLCGILLWVPWYLVHQCFRLVSHVAILIGSWCKRDKCVGCGVVTLGYLC